MQAKLVVVGGDIGTAEIPLRLPVIIGRSRDASLTLPHPLVSRHHCEIFEREGRLVVKDLGSRNGTYVSNERIQGETVLPAGELLTIGAVTFRAVYDDSSVAASRKDRGSRRQSARDNLMGGDSAIPLSDDELFREEDLVDDSFGVDSGHFGSPDDSRPSL